MNLIVKCYQYFNGTVHVQKTIDKTVRFSGWRESYTYSDEVYNVQIVW